MPNRKTSQSSERTGDLSPPTYCVEEDKYGNLVNKDLGVCFPERPSRGQYSRAREMQKLCCSVSPPTYRVEEDQYGNLVNKDLKVIYPALPSKGPHSLFQYLKSKKAAKGWNHNRKVKNWLQEKSYYATSGDDSSVAEGEFPSCPSICECLCKECACNLRKNLFAPPTAKEISGGSQSLSNINMPVLRHLSGLFVGSRTKNEIEEMLLPTQFLLYYRRPDQINSIDDVPLSQPLMIAYRANQLKVAHYRMKYYRIGNDERMWRVEIEGAPEQPSFFSLTKLIQYYKVFAVALDDSVEFFRIK